MNRFGILLVGSVFLIESPAFAKVVYFGGEEEAIPLTQDAETLLRFPSEVRTISRAERYAIQPADPSQPNYALLSVRPRFRSGGDHVTFILGDGTVIRSKLSVVRPSGAESVESFYDFKPKDSVPPDGGGGAGTSLSEIDLMKAMIRGDDIPGYEVKGLSRLMRPGFRGVTTRLIRIYGGNRFNGYVFEIANVLHDKRLSINIANIMLGDPNQALLSQVDRPVLETSGNGGEKTVIRIVAKPNSLYSKLILPIEIVKTKAEGKTP